MQLLTKLFCVILMVTIISCGPSAEEKAATEKARQDSIATVEKAKMDSIANMTKRAMETKQSLSSALEGMTNRLMLAKADLDVAHNDMDKIQEFHLMRTDEERQNQVRNQSLRIQGLEKEISDLETRIAEVKSKLSQVEQILDSH